MPWRLTRMRMLLAVLALAAGLGCGRLTVDDGRADVVGQVVDRDGAAVAGVRVMLIRDRRPTAETTTGADGRFALHGTPGPAGVFGLLDSTTDQGVWRGGLDLLPTGRTDVGTLELEAVWAHPEVLWLRGTGFDEQLTRPEDALTYLWGGGAGEPLLATHQGTSELEVWRVDDDGTPHLLTRQPWVDPDTVSVPVPTSPWPPVVYVSTGKARSGRALVLIRHGGHTWATAQGTQAMPVQRLTWLDAATGATVLDVQVPDGAEVSWDESRGALVSGGDGSSFASVALGRAVPLSSRLAGELFPTSAGIAVVSFDGPGLRVSRVDDDGRVTSSAPLSAPAGSTSTFSIGDVIVAMDSTADQLTVRRLDGVTLKTSADHFPLGDGPYTHGWGWLPSCDSSAPGVAVLETSDQGARLTTIDGSASTQSTLTSPDLPAMLSVACALPGGFWGVGQRRSDGVRVSFRTAAGQAVVTPLESDVLYVSRVGPWPLVVRRDNGVTAYLLGARDGSLEKASPLARIPFVTAPAGLSSDGTALFAQGQMGGGTTAVFRVRAPAEVSP